MNCVVADVCLLSGRPDVQRVGGAGGATNTVEKTRPCWQRAEEASAENTKHRGGLVGLLLCRHWYLRAELPNSCAVFEHFHKTNMISESKLNKLFPENKCCTNAKC